MAIYHIVAVYASLLLSVAAVLIGVTLWSSDGRGDAVQSPSQHPVDTLKVRCIEVYADDADLNDSHAIPLVVITAQGVSMWRELRLSRQERDSRAEKLVRQIRLAKKLAQKDGASIGNSMVITTDGMRIENSSEQKSFDLSLRRVAIRDLSSGDADMMMIESTQLSIEAGSHSCQIGVSDGKAELWLGNRHSSLVDNVQLVAKDDFAGLRIEPHGRDVAGVIEVGSRAFIGGRERFLRATNEGGKEVWVLPKK